MQVENQIRAGVEPPAHIVRRGFDERTGLPKQEVGVWFERVRARLGRDRIHARETWLATLSVATAERLLAVDCNGSRYFGCFGQIVNRPLCLDLSLPCHCLRTILALTGSLP